MLSFFSRKVETVGVVHAEALNQFKTELEKLKEFFNAQLQDKYMPKKVMKELSNKYKERLNKKANEIVINTLGKDHKSHTSPSEVPVKLEDSKLLVQSKEAKTLNKSMPVAQTIEGLLLSLQFSNRSNREDINEMILSLESTQASITDAFQRFYKKNDPEAQESYAYYARAENKLRNLVCRRTRNSLYNVLSALEKVSRFEHSDKIDYKAFDAEIGSYVSAFNRIRMQINPFSASHELVRERAACINK